jgi:DNA repair photolyase
MSYAYCVYCYAYCVHVSMDKGTEWLAAGVEHSKV